MSDDSDIDANEQLLKNISSKKALKNNLRRIPNKIIAPTIHRQQPLKVEIPLRRRAISKTNWRIQWKADGTIHYVNQETGETTIHRPMELQEKITQTNMTINESRKITRARTLGAEVKRCLPEEKRLILFQRLLEEKPEAIGDRTVNEKLLQMDIRFWIFEEDQRQNIFSHYVEKKEEDRRRREDDEKIMTIHEPILPVDVLSEEKIPKQNTILAETSRFKLLLRQRVKMASNSWDTVKSLLSDKNASFHLLTQEHKEDLLKKHNQSLVLKYNFFTKLDEDVRIAKETRWADLKQLKLEHSCSTRQQKLWFNDWRSSH